MVVALAVDLESKEGRGKARWDVAEPVAVDDMGVGEEATSLVVVHAAFPTV